MLLDRLIISENFYSIQGEGKTVGTPAVFLRLAGCNLRCTGFSYQDPVTKEHLGCDSKAVWRHGQKFAFNQILVDWQQQGWLEALDRGAHLVITGGEPVLQQTALVPFLQQLDLTLGKPCFVEMETNATLLIHPELLSRLNQINASPKLSNSGESLQTVYTKLHIEPILQHPNAIFKFVIAKKTDLDDVLTQCVIPWSLTTDRVYLMAEGGNRSALAEKEPWVIELCKEHGFQFSPRLHIHIWNEVTGV